MGCGRHKVPAAPLHVGGEFQVHRAGPGRTPPRCPASGNWLCFARFLQPISGKWAPNWVCLYDWPLPGAPFSRYSSLPKFGFVSHISLRPNWVCLARLTSVGGPPRRELGLFGAIRNRRIGFVSHVLHNGIRTCHPPDAPACPSLGLFGAFAPPGNADLRIGIGGRNWVCLYNRSLARWRDWVCFA